jgi:NAD-specific glutamate dehydrogenase
MPTRLSISLFEMLAQIKEEKYVVNVPSNYSKQIGASLCVQVVAQHVPYLLTLVSKHLHTSNPYIHLHSRERGK